MFGQPVWEALQSPLPVAEVGAEASPLLALEASPTRRCRFPGHFGLVPRVVQLVLLDQALRFPWSSLLIAQVIRTRMFLWRQTGMRPPLRIIKFTEQRKD